MLARSWPERLRTSFEERAPQLAKGDEIGLPGFIATLRKGLPQNQLGIVDADAFATLLRALATGRHADFEKITCGSGMKLVNPEAAFTYETEGADPHQFACP